MDELSASFIVYVRQCWSIFVKAEQRQLVFRRLLCGAY